MYQWFYRQASACYLVLALLFLTTLLVLGGQQDTVNALPSPVANMDKVYHFAAFSILAFFTWFYFKGAAIWKVVALVALAGVIDEAHQALLAFRTADLADLLTDVLAAALTAYLLRAQHQQAQMHDASFRGRLRVV